LPLGAKLRMHLRSPGWRAAPVIEGHKNRPQDYISMEVDRTTGHMEVTLKKVLFISLLT
jgi:hypothetical protein